MKLKVLPLTTVVNLPDHLLLDLVGQSVVIHIVETEDGVTEQAKVVGTVELLTLIEGGVVIKLVGAEEPVPVSADELATVSLTFDDFYDHFAGGAE